MKKSALAAFFAATSLLVFAKPKKELEFEGTKLALPPKIESESIFFVRDSSVPPQMVVASSRSLRKSVSSLRKTASDGQFPDEETLLFIAQSILEIAYSQDNIAQSKMSAYSGDDLWRNIIVAAKKGIFYDETAGDDFFSLVLPSLAVFAAKTTSPFFEKSLASLEKAQKKFPQSVLVQFLLGVLHEKNCLPKAAAQHYRATFAGDNSCEKIAVALARNLVETGASDAEDFCKSLLKSGFANSILPLYAQNCMNLGNIDEAKSLAEQGLEQNRLNYALHIVLAQVFMKKNDLKAAQKELAAYEKNAKKTPKFFSVRTEFLLQSGATMQAALNANAALKDFPHSLDLLLQAAKLVAQNGADIPELQRFQNSQGKTSAEIAEKIAEFALEKDEQDIRALEISAILAQKNQNPQKALDLANRFLALSKSVDVQTIKIDSLIAQNKTGEALAEAEFLFSQGRSEKSGGAYIRALVAARQNEKARALIDEFLPSSSSAWKSALLYQQSRIASNDEERIASLRYSLVSNPRNEECLLALYKFYYSKSDLRNARHYLRQLTAVNPNDKEYQRLLSAIEKKIRS